MSLGRPKDIALKKSGSSYRIIGASILTRDSNEFLKANETRGLSLHTIRGYGCDLVYFLKWLEYKSMTLEEMTHSKLYDFIETEREKKRKPSTINRKITTIQIFYRFVIGEGLPVGKGALMPRKRGRFDLGGGNKKLSSFLKIKEPKLIVQSLTPDDIEKFLERITKYRDLTIVFLMFMCGCRSCEIISLQISDINSL